VDSNAIYALFVAGFERSLGKLLAIKACVLRGASTEPSERRHRVSNQNWESETGSPVLLENILVYLAIYFLLVQRWNDLGLLLGGLALFIDPLNGAFFFAAGLATSISKRQTQWRIALLLTPAALMTVLLWGGLEPSTRTKPWLALLQQLGEATFYRHMGLDQRIPGLDLTADTMVMVSPRSD
jgi:hypothetical protein